MLPSLTTITTLLLTLLTLTKAQQPSTPPNASPGSGYTGYTLSLTDPSSPPDSVIYQTANTNASTTPAFPPPDVFLNASLTLSDLEIHVSNLSAQINLSAQVLSLLQFNAGVDLSIDAVSLSIFNVSANVLLEARLANLVKMINDTLESLDLNPSLAGVGAGVGGLVDGVAGGGGAQRGSPPVVVPRSFELENNILYSINDYSGNTHTNRILAQNGELVDQSLDNDGRTYARRVVGDYSTDMSFNGISQSVVRNGEVVRELEYVYGPFVGVNVVSAVYVDEGGKVVGTQVLSESGGGGSSTVGGTERE